MHRHGYRPRAPDLPVAAVDETELQDVEISAHARLLTADELQSLTSIAKSWWLAEARADRIPHIRAGKYVRFVFSEVVQFLRERSAGLREHR